MRTFCNKPERIQPLCILFLLVIQTISANATIQIIEQNGWYESIYASWTAVESAAKYEVRYSGDNGHELIVDEYLIRQYPNYYRVDVPGLKAGHYRLHIIAFDAQNQEIERTESDFLEAKPFLREGYAFTDGMVPGAYQSDGTPKEGARIIYLSANNVNTVTCEVSDGKKNVTYSGIGNILNAYSKGRDKRPLIIRVIACLNASEIEGLKDGNYLNFQGNNTSDRILENITLEGIGNDATLYGFGLCFKRTKGLEVRNLGIMLYGDDGISMDTDNYHNWIHHNDFFYGAPGSDADQVKGDGSIDLKYRSTLITIDHNHFFDSGKVMGCGGATKESTNLLISFHHNWFDHTDSRCPRLNHTTAHIYNNYYDGVSVYGIGCTEVSNAFIEYNHFRNCQRPMMIAGQGTDRKYASDPNKGTFSGQSGGMSKAFNNLVEADIEIRLSYQSDDAEQYDAWLVQSREEKVPETAKSYKGGHIYDNFDTHASMYSSNPDPVENLAEIVSQGAGRLQGGDFKWNFNQNSDDRDHEVNQALKNAILNYKSSLISIQAENTVNALYRPHFQYQGPYFDLQGKSVQHAEKPGIYIDTQNNHPRKFILK